MREAGVNEGNVRDLLCPLPMAAVVKCSHGTAPCRQLHQTFTRWGLPAFIDGDITQESKACAPGDTAQKWWSQYNKNRHGNRCQDVPTQQPAVCRKPGGWV